ncbi:DNA primase [Methylobacterium mesophilicum SR1.6/6]|uniref:DNA primase n=1 Tax=Methylobacterium mesophilicum SR1.6/6 TaxID=908290 RepID=A0A6B9FLC6_9HYPH|nr:DNA primase [Methylobacterium mesophilicum]QGY03380.1 DNA primase [Methylobacterium mesophilicum SR1.6/6]
MRYPPHILEEIRARLPASSVVGRRVQLKKAGREWRGLSPFNAEKTPSFYVNDQKQFYHCFSSSKHGDIFTFLMETEGLSFPEAVERLAGEAGVSLPAPTEDNRAAETKRAGAIEVMEMAARWFEERLRSGQGSEARTYLERRALAPEVQERFRLGYAPNERYALRDHLAGQGVDKALMVEMGLLAAGEGVSVPYDYFRDRVMFPITDTRGRVVAFGGRALAKEVRAKYLNSPETPLFHKGRTLYNLHGARKAAHDRSSIIAVEGYVDVIAMTLAGHPETVAPLGTALTEDQLGLLWRHADEPILCFDGDKAGQRAAFRALDLALPLLEPGRSLRIALLPGGQDPDDLLRSGGPAAIDQVLKAALPLSELLWRRAVEAGPVDTPERRAGLTQTLRTTVATIRDETVRRYYRDEIEERLRGLSPRGARAAGPATRGRTRFTRPGEPVSPRITGGPSPSVTASAGFTGAAAVREAVIIGTLLAHPEMLADFAEEIAEFDFEDPDAQALLSVLLASAAEEQRTDPDVLQNRITRAGLAAASDRILTLARSRDRTTLAPHADPAHRADALRQAMILHRQAGALHSELREARQAFENDPTDAGWAWLCEVKARLETVIAAEAEADVPVSNDSTAA